MFNFLLFECNFRRFDNINDSLSFGLLKNASQKSFKQITNNSNSNIIEKSIMDKAQLPNQSHNSQPK